MGRVLTNNTSLAVAIEDALGILPAQPVWDLLEPNSIGAFGATISTVARDPISRNRQRRKGTITDLDSAVDFDADLTASHFDVFAEGFIFSNFLGEVDRVPSAVSGVEFTVDVGTALPANTLVRGVNFAEAGNNAIHVVTGSTTTTIIAATLTVEATPPANARVEVIGYEFAATDLTVTVTGTEIALDSTASSWADVSLQVGQYIHIGDTANANRFNDAPNVDSSGLVRVVSITDAQVIVDKPLETFATTPSVGSIRVFTGQFLSNVSTDDANFLERSYQFELEYPGLAANGNDSMYGYAKGNFCNTLAITAPLADKASVAFAFVGTDTAPPTATRAQNAAAATEPAFTSAYNTTTDCARMRIAQVDGTGLSTDFKSLTVNLNNNVSPEKVLCNLGAKYMNYGNFEVNIEAQLVFTESAVTEAIRANETVSMEFALSNDDGAIVFDIPSMTLGGGDVEFPVNESVLINVTSEAFQDAVTGNSIGISKLAYVPEM